MLAKNIRLIQEEWSKIPKANQERYFKGIIIASFKEVIVPHGKEKQDKYYCGLQFNPSSSNEYNIFNTFTNYSISEIKDGVKTAYIAFERITIPDVYSDVDLDKMVEDITTLEKCPEHYRIYRESRKTQSPYKAMEKAYFDGGKNKNGEWLNISSMIEREIAQVYFNKYYQEFIKY